MLIIFKQLSTNLFWNLYFNKNTMSIMHVNHKLPKWSSFMYRNLIALVDDLLTLSFLHDHLTNVLLSHKSIFYRWCYKASIEVSLWKSSCSTTVISIRLDCYYKETWVHKSSLYLDSWVIMIEFRSSLLYSASLLYPWILIESLICFNKIWFVLNDCQTVL